MQTATLVAEPVPETWDRSGLPGWAYHSPAFLALEKAELFATHWQIVCHVADLPAPGAWVSLDIGDDRALVIRGQDGVIRALHNLCRHRGARVAAGDSGQCKNALVCPFHGWVYNLDGTLRGPARPKTFGDLDRSQYGLRPMECEIWNGFVFVRCRPGPQGSVAETLAPFAADFADYRLDDLDPDRPGLDLRDRRQLEVGPRRRQRGLPRRHGPPGACRTSTAPTTATTSAPRASAGRSPRSAPTAAAAGACATT